MEIIENPLFWVGLVLVFFVLWRLKARRPKEAKVPPVPKTPPPVLTRKGVPLREDYDPAKLAFEAVEEALKDSVFGQAEPTAQPSRPSPVRKAEDPAPRRPLRHRDDDTASLAFSAVEEALKESVFGKTETPPRRKS